MTKTHTVDTLMALADTYAQADSVETLSCINDTQEDFTLAIKDRQQAKEALRTALTEALSAQPILGTKTWIEGGVVMTQNLTASDIYLPLQAAQPVREPLTDAQMLKAIRHLYKNEWIAEQALNVSIDDFRAIERAHGIGGDTNNTGGYS